MVSAAGSSPVLVPGLEVLVSDDVLPGLLVMPAQLSVVPLDKENGRLWSYFRPNSGAM